MAEIQVALQILHLRDDEAPFPLALAEELEEIAGTLRHRHEHHGSSLHESLMVMSGLAFEGLTRLRYGIYDEDGTAIKHDNPAQDRLSGGSE